MIKRKRRRWKQKVGQKPGVVEDVKSTVETLKGVLLKKPDTKPAHIRNGKNTFEKKSRHKPTSADSNGNSTLGEDPGCTFKFREEEKRNKHREKRLQKETKR